MPFYTDPTLYSSPIPSYALYLSGPYSNHSSLIGASSYARSNAYSKPLSRFHRGYAPHLATITENKVNSSLRRKYSPHLSALHTSSHKYKVPRPIRINTADIDVSADRYKPRPLPHITHTKTIPREYKREVSKSPSPKLDDAEFVPKPIRRDRPTVRLHTVHKGEEKDQETSIKTEDENSSHEVTQKVNEQPNKLEKNPSFHDICTAISHDKINEQLNPGQPEDICRLQSRTSNEDLLNQRRRSSTELTKDNIALLDQILQEEEKRAERSQKKFEPQPEEYDSRGSVKRKKRIVRRKTSESLVSDEETKSPIQRRALKKIKRTSTDSSLQSDTSENLDNSEKEPEEVIRDISKVEIEEIKTKPKPLISAVVNVEETIPNLKLIVDDVKVEEVLSPKTHPRKFKFNVTVNVEATKPKVNKVIPPKSKITDDDRGKVHMPKAKGAIVSNVRQNNKQRGSLGDIYEDKEVPKRVAKKTDLHQNHVGLNGDIQAKKLEEMKFKNEDIKSETIREEITSTKKCDVNNEVGVEKLVDDVLLIKSENKNDIILKDPIKDDSALPSLVDEALSKDEKQSFNVQSSSPDKMDDKILSSPKEENKAAESKDEVLLNAKEENKNSISQTQDDVLVNSKEENENSTLKNYTVDILQNKTPPSPKEENKSQLLPSSSVQKPMDTIQQNKPEEKPNDVSKITQKTPFKIAQKKLFIEPKKIENENKKLDFRRNLNKVQNITIKDQTPLKNGPQSPVTKTPTPPPQEEEQDFWGMIDTRRSIYRSPSTFFKQKSEDVQQSIQDDIVEKVNGTNLDEKNVINEDNKTKLQESILNKINEQKNDEIKVLSDRKDLKTVAKDKKDDLNTVANDKKDEIKIVANDKKEDLKTVANAKTEDLKFVADNKKENLKILANGKKEDVKVVANDEKEDSKPIVSTENDAKPADIVDTNKNETASITDSEEIIPKRMISKEPEPEPEPEPESPQPTGFVPLQSNRMSLSQFMHPFKKPEQFDECPVEIYARPKTIRKRHFPRPRNQPPPPVQKATDSDDDDSEEESDETDDTSEEDTNSEDEGNVGKSTSSNDSGFNSSNGSPAMHTNKGTSDARDSPTSNPAHNPAFALDPGDNLEELFTSSTYAGFQKSGRITPPATTIPRFRKYSIEDFNFLKVLGKGSFGKVLLAELKDTEYYYAIKCLKKDVVLEDDDVECTLIERKVLALGTKHPYLCHLLCTFQTESHLFFVMEYLNGGDLMFHIQTSGRFTETRACIYAAEIVTGLKFLHSKGIIYRDLKLDNILLDFDGHVRIADFGMCKLQIFLDRTADTFCGTPDYMAPEIIKGLHYNQNADWWSYGVLLYEMLIGQSPFSGCDEDELFWSICNEKPVFPRFLSPEALSILKQLLEKDSNKRLGNKFCPHGDIQDHIFFRSISWDLLERRQIDSPFKPNLQHPLDTQYFDRTFTVEKAKLTPIDKNILQSMDQAQFQGFSYTNPNATDR